MGRPGDRKGGNSFVERIAMRRMGPPEDIAHAVMFLASDYAWWITGQILPVMGSPSRLVRRARDFG